MTYVEGGRGVCFRGWDLLTSSSSMEAILDMKYPMPNTINNDMATVNQVIPS